MLVYQRVPLHLGLRIRHLIWRGVLAALGPMGPDMELMEPNDQDFSAFAAFIKVTT